MATTFNTNNGKEVISDLERIQSALNSIESSTIRNNKALNTYTKTMSSLNNELNAYVGMSGGATGSNKFKTPKQLGLGTQAQQMQRNAKQIENASKQSSKAILGLVKNMYGANTTKAVTALTSVTVGIKGLGAAGAAAVNPITLLAAAIGAMGAAGLKAYDNNMKLNRALMSMGSSANELTRATSDSANKFITAKNNLKDSAQALAEVFTPIVDVFADLAVGATDFIKGVTGSGSQARSSDSSGSKVRWYTEELSKYGISEQNSIPALAEIANTAKQSGFTNSSAANLAIGTYDMAIAKAKEYGLESQDVAKQIADAWLKGSDAAKEYGVVVNDTVLTGYMSEQGVDLATTKVTEAMKQYYRYQLVQTELSASSNDIMQEQIKNWTELGTAIEGAAGNLTSLDEFETLKAVNPEVPDVGQQTINIDNWGELQNSLGELDTKAKNLSNSLNNVSSANSENVDSNVENSEAINENTDAIEANTEATEANTEAENNNTEAIEENTTEVINNYNSLEKLYSDYENGVISSEQFSEAINGLSQILANDSSIISTFDQIIANSITNMDGLNQQLGASALYENTMIVYNQLLQNSLDMTNESINTLMQSLINFQTALNNTGRSVSQEAQEMANLAQQVYNAAYAYQALHAAKTTGNASSSSSSSSGSSNRLSSFTSAISGLGSSVKSAASGFLNNLTIGVSGGLSSAYSAYKNTSGSTASKVNAAVKSGVAGITNNLANKLSFGATSVGVNSSTGKINASTNISNLSPLEIIDYLDALKENNYDVIGTTKDAAISSTTGLASTFKNQYNNGSNFVTGTMSGLTAAATWALLEEGADISTAWSYVTNLFGADSRTIDAYKGKTTSETYMNMLQAGVPAKYIERVMKLSDYPDSLKLAAQAVISARNVEILEGIKDGSNVESTLTQLGLATGGIGVKETTARLFEGNKKEAVIPLEDGRSPQILADSLVPAIIENLNNAGGARVSITNNFNDTAFFDNDDSMKKLASKMSDIIEQELVKNGSMGYGTY